MARTNTKTVATPIRTHEGAPAKRINALSQLKRTVLCCLLWEKGFYEDGVEIVTRIAGLVPECQPEDVAALAITARNDFHLRHVPLLLVRLMASLDSHKYLVASTLEAVIQRPDELAEFVSLYWETSKKKNQTPLSSQIKKGLAKAFTKFDAYSLAKWNRDNDVKLRDVLFLTHPKPLNKAQEKTWKQLVDGTLPIPDTWEVELSNNDGVSKKDKWTRLIKEGKLFAMAYLMNLRNMTEAGVSADLIRSGLEKVNTEKMFPYRFISAARVCPQFEDVLETKMLECLKGFDKLSGKTIVLIDVSGSMDGAMSAKSDITRLDAACGLAIIARELGEKTEVFTFSHSTVQVPPRHGFALKEAIHTSQSHGGTYLGQAIKQLGTREYDRLIVLTDEQSHDSVDAPKSNKNYLINVANCQNGVGYGKGWTLHIDGWSDKVFSFIQEYENYSENKD